MRVAHEDEDFLGRAKIANPGTTSVCLALFQDFPLYIEVLTTVFELPNVLRQSRTSTLVGMSETSSVPIVPLLESTRPRPPLPLDTPDPEKSFGTTPLSIRLLSKTLASNF